MLDENKYLLGLFAKLGLEVGFDLDRDEPFVEWAGIKASYGTLVPSDEKSMVLSLEILLETYEEITVELLRTAATRRPDAVGALRVGGNQDETIDLFLYTDQVLCLDERLDEIVLRGALQMLELSLEALQLP